MKKQRISILKYNKLMEKIIAKRLPVADNLIEMLNMAGSYDVIINNKRKKK